MAILDAIFLGFVQGLTEFLPISSSGHLVLMRRIIGLDLESAVLFDTLLHTGTLVSVVLVFWKDIKEMFIQFIGFFADLCRGKLNTSNPYRRLIIMLIIATVPLVFVIPLKDLIEKAFENVALVGVALLVTGTFLTFSKNIKPGALNAGNAKFRTAFFVGLVQMCALIPGISRSGSTIVAGEFVGFDKKFAAKFSFLMSIIAILGATITQIPDVAQSGELFDLANTLPYLAGMIVAAITGILAIRFMLRLIMRGRFHYFGIYCYLAGFAALFMSLYM